MTRLSVFVPVGLVFPVWSLDSVPKLYQLKLQCVNVQLNRKRIICYNWAIHKFTMLQKRIKVEPFTLFLTFIFPGKPTNIFPSQENVNKIMVSHFPLTKYKTLF